MSSRKMVLRLLIEYKDTGLLLAQKRREYKELTLFEKKT